MTSGYLQVLPEYRPAKATGAWSDVWARVEAQNSTYRTDSKGGTVRGKRRDIPLPLTRVAFEEAYDERA